MQMVLYVQYLLYAPNAWQTICGAFRPSRTIQISGRHPLHDTWRTSEEIVL